MWTGGGYRTTGATWSPPASNPGVHGPHSAWHSPVPYLFGGLVAILGLIAMALLILACSNWKLGKRGSEDQGGERKPGENGAKPPAGSVDQFVVIMAGDLKPTVLATPISIGAATFDSDTDANNKNKNAGVDDGKKLERAVSHLCSVAVQA